MDSITDELFRDLRIIFRKAMDQDLAMCARVIKFRLRWWSILTELETTAWKYVDCGDRDWEEFVKELLKVE